MQECVCDRGGESETQSMGGEGERGREGESEIVRVREGQSERVGVRMGEM